MNKKLIHLAERRSLLVKQAAAQIEQRWTYHLSHGMRAWRWPTGGWRCSVIWDATLP